MLPLGLGTSCDKVTEDITAANALIGVWRPDGANVTVMSDGMEIVAYLTTNFGYTTAEAEEMRDEIIADQVNYNLNKITFYGDRTYVLVKSDLSETEDKWAVNSEGNILNLYNGEKVDTIKIQDQTSSRLELLLQAVVNEADFDLDGENESLVEVTTTIKLTKTSRGGMGQ